jgi:hypothetical protein
MGRAETRAKAFISASEGGQEEKKFHPHVGSSLERKCTKIWKRTERITNIMR